MPRFNVKYENKYACFSTIVDGFLTNFAERPHYDCWRKNEYGDNVDEIENSNNMKISEAVKIMLLHRTKESVVDELIYVGIPKSVARRIVIQCSEMED